MFKDLNFKYLRNAMITCVFILALTLLLFEDTISIVAEATQSYEDNIELTCNSYINVDVVFGEYMSAVDETLYYSLTKVNGESLIEIFGDKNTPMFIKAKECINPCMAFATTWGEAGSSYPGVSMTTVMDFNPNTYVDVIDWLNVAQHLEQIDTQWYCANVKRNFNTNEEGEAYHIANALLQVPRNGERSTSTMEGLGVGSFQITSSNWDEWDLDTRINPIYSWYGSLQKVGTSWINCGINPISDLTVYAVLSLGHQGGGLINYEFGKELISLINTVEVQNAFNQVGSQMYDDLWFKTLSKDVSLADLNVGTYLAKLEALTGIDFSDYTGGPGSSNKGNYVAQHCLRYVFYKNYFTRGTDDSLYEHNQVWNPEIDNKGTLSAQSNYVYGSHEHIAYNQYEFQRDLSLSATLAGAGCGWCSLTSAMAELNPTMCGGISPADWLDTEMKAVGESYWGSDGMSWSGPGRWIKTINEIGLYGTYEIIDYKTGCPSDDVIEAIRNYAADEDKVVLVSAAPGLFTSGGHIMCVTDLTTDSKNFHIADSSPRAANNLHLLWEEMYSYDFPIDSDGVGEHKYNFKCYWVIQRKDV